MTSKESCPNEQHFSWKIWLMNIFGDSRAVGWLCTEALPSEVSEAADARSFEKWWIAWRVGPKRDGLCCRTPSHFFLLGATGLIRPLKTVRGTWFYICLSLGNRWNCSCWFCRKEFELFLHAALTRIARRKPRRRTRPNDRPQEQRKRHRGLELDPQQIKIK